MPDYKKGKIYTIRCTEDPTLIYVGSTIQLLSQRWTDHKKRCNHDTSNAYNLKVYTKIREVGGVAKFYIELYEDYPCENKEQLLKREGEIIRQIGTLNKVIAGRTKQEYNKEYYDHHKDYLKECNKKYYDTNKETISENRKEKIKCVCGCEGTKRNLYRHQKSKQHIQLMEIKNSQTNI